MKKMIQRIRDRRRDRARRKMTRGASFLKTFAVATLVISALLNIPPMIFYGKNIKKERNENNTQARIALCEGEVQSLGLRFSYFDEVVRGRTPTSPTSTVNSERNPDLRTLYEYTGDAINRMNHRLQTWWGENAWWCIYDKSNQTILLDSTQLRYLIEVQYHRSPVSDTIYYWLDDSQIDMMVAHSNVAGEVQLTITSAYLKEDEILIGSYIIGDDQVEHQCDLSEYSLQDYRYVKLERDETIYEDGQTKVCYVGSDCGIKISMDPESTISRIGGYEATPQLMKKAQKWFQKSKDKVVKAESEHELYKYFKTVQTQEGFFYHQYEYIADSVDYRVMVVFADSEENMIRQAMKEELLCCVLISVLVSVFIALTRYLRSKQTREVYVYRNTLNTAMAHDLKTPLMAISGYTENIAEDVNPDKREHYVDGIANQVDYMNKMIDGILELAKAEETTSDEKVQINLKSLTETVIENLKEELEKRKLTVQVTGTGIVRANRQSMETVIRNLIENACKYAPEGGTVTVAVSNKRYSVTNELTESITVAPEKLLEPFTKGDTSRSGRKGTGLGLAIVKNICDEHGFQVRLKTGDGKFCIEIVFA